MFWNNSKIGTYIVQDHKNTTSLWIKNNASVKESNTHISAKESINQMDEKKINVKVIKFKKSKCRKLGFSHGLEQYLDRYMKDHYKNSSLWNEINESVQESNSPN